MTEREGAENEQGGKRGAEEKGQNLESIMGRVSERGRDRGRYRPMHSSLGESGRALENHPAFSLSLSLSFPPSPSHFLSLSLSPAHTR